LVIDQRAFLAVLRIYQWQQAQKPVKPTMGMRIQMGSKR
jgi:hypothetical protein